MRAFTKVSHGKIYELSLVGIGAASMREASYSSLRLGLYEPMKSVTGAD